VNIRTHTSDRTGVPVNSHQSVSGGHTIGEARTGILKAWFEFCGIYVE